MQNGELFYTLHEAHMLIKRWRRHYNTQRPHSALGYRPPTPEARTLTQQVTESLGAGHSADPVMARPQLCALEEAGAVIHSQS